MGCEHLSASGISTRDLNAPEKVWRCDGCGWLHVFVRLRDGVDGVERSVDVEDRLSELDAEVRYLLDDR